MEGEGEPERRGGRSWTLFGINPDTQEATGARLGEGESLPPTPLLAKNLLPHCI